MTNARGTIGQVDAMLDEARIAKSKRQDIDRRLTQVARAVGHLPVTVDGVPNPNVDPEWYSGGYYWQHNDRAQARNLTPADAKVRAVNVDAMSERDVEERRSPSGWHPRVEVTFTADEHRLVGDLTAEQATDLATALLAAAALVRR